MTDIKDVKDEVETVTHNIAHPEDETDKQARKRQPWMPIIGSAIVAIILFACYAFFFK